MGPEQTETDVWTMPPDITERVSGRIHGHPFCPGNQGFNRVLVYQRLRTPQLGVPYQNVLPKTFQKYIYIQNTQTSIIRKQTDHFSKNDNKLPNEIFIAKLFSFQKQIFISNKIFTPEYILKNQNVYCRNHNKY